MPGKMPRYHRVTVTVLANTDGNVNALCRYRKPTEPARKRIVAAVHPSIVQEVITHPPYLRIMYAKPAEPKRKPARRTRRSPSASGTGKKVSDACGHVA
eukprot:CAMPEP_0170214640 /NCGR_PEP_ID=MMETSP0116_2-20130129/6952_1 /TAXON_ID=400756 /ORGANISM="Durinskia baltica, Strain CSIRO CS-38" /LENGTH=98 /DNA_ID=CAMNT_0010465207 /DNA_START=361 /DNA_END=654 /DNA_ORIENTATION=+